MNRMYLLAILVAIIIFVSYARSEGFISYIVSHDPKYCPECGKMSRSMCSSCTNCGYCINSRGVGECVPGDSTGPYFRKDCLTWDYNAPSVTSVYPIVGTYSLYSPYYYRYPRHRRYWRRRW